MYIELFYTYIRLAYGLTRAYRSQAQSYPAKLGDLAPGSHPLPEPELRAAKSLARNVMSSEEEAVSPNIELGEGLETMHWLVLSLDYSSYDMRGVHVGFSLRCMGFNSMRSPALAE